MKIAELLDEQQLTPQQQIAKDTELITQHILKQRQQQQQSQQQPAAPSAPQAAPQKIVTPDMIAKHPQYKSWYDKYYKMEFSKDGNPASAASQAKIYADGKIRRLIQQGQ